MRKKSKQTYLQALMEAAASDPRTPEECIEFVNKIIDTDNATRGMEAIAENARIRSEWLGYYGRMKTKAPSSSKANTPKRIRKPHIHYKEAITILRRLNVPKDRKTIQRWLKGEGTPKDFTPECMTTIQAFVAWATIYANREQAKINVRNTLRIDNPNCRAMGKFR